MMPWIFPALFVFVEGGLAFCLLVMICEVLRGK